MSYTPPVGDATTSHKGIIKLAGDMAGTSDAPSVTRLKGVAITNSPTASQVLSANSPTSASWKDAAAISGQTVVLYPEDFGAAGNGTTDDTASLQAALNALGTGKQLMLRSGKIYCHSAVLQVNNAGSYIFGGGTLLATAEATSSVWLAANDITLDGVTLKMQSTTKRWDAPEQHKLTVGWGNGNTTERSGISVRGVTIEGSAAAGIFVNTTSNYLIDNSTVRNTRADGFHNTNGSHHGTIRNCTAINTGDDGFAVVSYAGDGKICNHICFNDVKVFGTTWGRGLTVIGGENITYDNFYADNTAGAGVLASSEAGYNTYGIRDVTFRNGILRNCNTAASSTTRVDMGSLLLYAGVAGRPHSDNIFDSIIICDTNAGASRHLGVLAENGIAVTGTQLKNISVMGTGSKRLLNDSGVPYGTGYVATNLSYNGTQILPNNTISSCTGTAVNNPSDYTGGGRGVLSLAETSLAPTTNSVDGGIVYIQGGALKYRGSNGTITTIAPA